VFRLVPPRQFDTCLLLGMWLLLCVAFAAGTESPRSGATLAPPAPASVESTASGDADLILPHQPGSLRAPPESSLGAGKDQPHPGLRPAGEPQPAPSRAAARQSVPGSQPAQSYVSVRTHAPRGPPNGSSLAA